MDYFNNIFKKTTVIRSAAGVLALMLSASSYAAVKTYTWTAQVTSVYDGGQVLLGAIQSGDTISGAFSMDTTSATDGNPSPDTALFYPVRNGDGIQIDAGKLRIGSLTSKPCAVVYDNHSSTFDQYYWSGNVDCGYTLTGGDPAYLTPDYTSISLVDDTGTAMTGELRLEDTLPALSAWTTTKTVQFGNSNYTVIAKLVTLNPKIAAKDDAIFMSPGDGVFVQGQQFDLAFGVYQPKDGSYPYVVSNTLTVNGVTLSDAEFNAACMWAPAGKTAAGRAVLNAWLCPGFSMRLPRSMKNRIEATVTLSNGESHQVSVVMETL